MEKLFIYGSLGPGGPNNHIMEDIGGTWAPATVRGHLKKAGWGAELGFPGIVPDENGEAVQGYVFRSHNLANHWTQLDEFEGNAYARVLVPVFLDTGETLKAYVYALKL